MADNELLELHKQHRAAQDKYAYFLLAVAASAIAFAVQKTDSAAITASLAPLGLAVLCWGLSFFCGVKHLNWVQTSLYANYGLLQLSKGVHPSQPDHPALLELAKQGVREALDHNVDKAAFYATAQFRLLISGGVLFVFWHVIEMYLRTCAL